MVEETLLCVMNWYENPAQAQLVLQDTIPHHVDTFDIPLDQFYSVFEGLFDVVAQNIPQDESAQIDAWQTLMDEMRAYIHSDAVL